MEFPLLDRSRAGRAIPKYVLRGVADFDAVGPVRSVAADAAETDRFGRSQPAQALSFQVTDATPGSIQFILKYFGFARSVDMCPAGLDPGVFVFCDQERHAVVVDPIASGWHGLRQRLLRRGGECRNQEQPRKTQRAGRLHAIVSPSAESQLGCRPAARV